MNIASNLKRFVLKKDTRLRESPVWQTYSLNTVMKIESGTNKNPTIDTLSRIAKALKVGVDDLIKK